MATQSAAQNSPGKTFEATQFKPTPNNLEAFFMPFTSNRAFKAKPRLFVKAEGMHYTTIEGRKVLDASAGLWCMNCGHGRKEIAEAVSRQIAEMDYAPPFNAGHPASFELASRVAALLPAGLDHVFFTNSGSESVDSALKIALAYHRAKGQGTRQKLIGRDRGYHGVGFGGISVGGMVNNRKWFGNALNGVDHLPHTYNRAEMAYSKGMPAWGLHLADELEKLVALHDASNIAAVIVEPVACSTGVLVPPQGYLQKLREICTKHGILLIFDEVITGFGRLGASFATEYFGVKPDLITCAKGLTNGSIPMGAVIVSKEIYDTFMNSSAEGAIELFHGYTYSAHPVACAAGLAALDIYKNENLFDRVKELSPYWQDAVHSLKGAKHVVDIRNIGLIGAVELEPRAGKPGARGQESFVAAYEAGVLTRVTGDTIAMSPPFIVEKSQIDQMVNTLRDVLNKID
jgi:beta-alanine--pyruvate transaminase